MTLVDGPRREVLPVDMLYAGASRDPNWKKHKYCDCEVLFDRTYFAPLGDTTRPDDTLVELEYWTTTRGDPPRRLRPARGLRSTRAPAQTPASNLFRHSNR